MEAKLTIVDTTSVEVKRLHELLMDLLVVEKTILAILTNCDNQTVVAKVASKDNEKSLRHVKWQLKSIKKLRNSRVMSVTYIQTNKKLVHPFTEGLSHDRKCIEGYGYETCLSYHDGNPTYVIGGPVN